MGRDFELVFGDFRRGAGKSREIKCQVVLERSDSAGRRQDALYFDRVIGMKIDAIETSMGAARLILCADGFLKQIAFDVDGFCGQRMLSRI